MSGDWEVVEEALLDEDDLAYTWPQQATRCKAALAALARLREREVQLIKDNANAWTEGWQAPQARLVAAEARVAKLEESDARWERMNGYLDNVIHKERARVARLEEALREIANPPGIYSALKAADIARRALTHEEEA